MQTTRQVVIRKLTLAGGPLAAALLAIMPESANPYGVMNVLSNKYATLSQCFDWSESPQGFKYWSLLADRLPRGVGWGW